MEIGFRDTKSQTSWVLFLARSLSSALVFRGQRSVERMSDSNFDFSETFRRLLGGKTSTVRPAVC